MGSEESYGIQGQFELVGQSIAQRYDIPDRAELSGVSIMGAIFYCEPCISLEGFRLEGFRRLTYGIHEFMINNGPFCSQKF